MAAVIFDLDDTLYPHVQYVHSGFAAVALHAKRYVGLPADTIYTALRYARDTGHHGTEFQRLCEVHGLDAAIVPDLVHVYRTHAPQLWLSHGAALALETLRAGGWQLALLTNGVPAIQAAKVRALGLETLVDHVVYANEHAEGGKPAPEPFLEVLRRLQLDPDEVVMVGDDPINDVHGARAVGIRTILLSRAGRRYHDGGDCAVHLLADVPRVAAGLTSRGMAHAA